MLNVIIMYILVLERESEICLKVALLFLGCSSLVFESFQFPDKQLFEPALVVP